MLDPIESLFTDADAATKLRLADSYMLQKHRFGTSFVLPKEHRALQPLIDRFTRNFPRFVSYVRDVRDAAPARSESYIALHELYRTLEVRVVQQERRVRAGRALRWLGKHHRELTVEQRAKWVRKVEQLWGRRRLALMEAARRRAASGRLNTNEREEMLKAFWKEIDAEISSGELPKP